MTNFLFLIEQVRVDVASVELLSTWCTKPTEALLLLIVENSYDAWVQDATHPEEERNRWRPEELVKFVKDEPEWTSGGNTGRKYSGWHKDGIERFNEIMDEVGKDRSTKKNGELLEKALMRKLKHLNAGRKRKRNVTSYVTVTPKFDMPEGFQHNDDEEDENDDSSSESSASEEEDDDNENDD